MFEKEAEEYRNNNTNYYEWDSFCADDGEAIETAYQKGAEFGYNKAKEEAKDIINELLMNGYSENTREQALNFLYPDKEE